MCVFTYVCMGARACVGACMYICVGVYVYIYHRVSIATNAIIIGHIRSFNMFDSALDKPIWIFGNKPYNI